MMSRGPPKLARDFLESLQFAGTGSADDVRPMQQENETSENNPEKDQSSRKGLTRRRSSGAGLDSIVSGMREQEDRRRRSTPRSDEDPTSS